jgi:hypothetical protein
VTFGYHKKFAKYKDYSRQPQLKISYFQWFFAIEHKVIFSGIFLATENKKSLFSTENMSKIIFYHFWRQKTHQNNKCKNKTYYFIDFLFPMFLPPIIIIF